MLMPKKVKYRKHHRGRRRGKALRGGTVAFGEFGLQAQSAAWITARQIEAARVAMTRHVKRGGKIWIRIFPDKPVTKKPAEVRPGRIMYEIEGVEEAVAREAMKRASAKLPIPTKFVKRRLEELTC